MRRAGLYLCVLVLATGQACKGEGILRYNGGELPQTLSEWGLFQGELRQLQPVDGVVPYDLNTPLFSDYAHKFRTMSLPPGEAAPYNPDQVFALPVGTVISKTFYFEDSEIESIDGSAPSASPDGRRLIETRILVHTDDGWLGLPYVWDEAMTEARLKIAGAGFLIVRNDALGGTRELHYAVPDMNQCASCHVTNAAEHENAMTPIGPAARHLNRDYAYADGTTENQLTHWQSIGFLSDAPAPETAPRHAVWNEPETGSVDERARAYLDANCAHCHSPTGPARTSGLNLRSDVAGRPHWGVCKTPVAAGRGSGGFSYDIVPGNPDRSILFFRMASVDPGIMMPEIGRSVEHTEGVALMRQWIASLEGSCAGL